MPALTPALHSTTHRWDLFACLAIAIGTAIRCTGIGTEALWFDEVMTVEHLAGSTWLDVKGVLTRVDPPLYYAFMWVWIPLAGTSELALRLPSLLCAILALVLIWRWARAWFSPAAGAAAAALLAANPFAILYAQEARFYEPLLLCGLLATRAWDRLVLENGARRELAIYALCGAALFYLHFMGVLLVAGHALYLWTSGLDRDARRRGFRGLLGVAVLVAPYLLGVVYLYAIDGAGHREWIHRTGGAPGAQHLFTTLAILSGMQAPQLRESWPWLELLPVLLASAGLLHAVLALGSDAVERQEKQRLRLHAFTLVVPLFALALLSQRKSIYLDRYLIAGLPSAVLLAGYGLVRATACCSIARSIVLTLAAVAVALPFGMRWNEIRKADWPAALEQVARDARAGDVLLVDGPVDRPERASEGVDITTCHFYRRAHEAERGAQIPARIVTLPFDLLRRSEWNFADPNEQEELDRARVVERDLLALRGCTLWVAATLEPWKSPSPERPLQQTSLWKALHARASKAEKHPHQRLELWSFELRDSSGGN